jgi:hypothetical protein
LKPVNIERHIGRRPLIDALLKRRALVAPLKDEIATARAYFLIVEPHAAKRPAVRALEAWLIEQARMSAPRRSLDVKVRTGISAATS